MGNESGADQGVLAACELRSPSRCRCCRGRWPATPAPGRQRPATCPARPRRPRRRGPVPCHGRGSCPAARRSDRAVGQLPLVHGPAIAALDGRGQSRVAVLLEQPPHQRHRLGVVRGEQPAVAATGPLRIQTDQTHRVLPPNPARPAEREEAQGHGGCAAGRRHRRQFDGLRVEIVGRSTLIHVLADHAPHFPAPAEALAEKPTGRRHAHRARRAAAREPILHATPFRLRFRTGSIRRAIFAPARCAGRRSPGVADGRLPSVRRAFVLCQRPVFRNRRRLITKFRHRSRVRSSPSIHRVRAACSGSGRPAMKCVMST